MFEKYVLQSLVDDGMVQADKIGSSNCTKARDTMRMQDATFTEYKFCFLEATLKIQI
jgi:hypothetical protein